MGALIVEPQRFNMRNALGSHQNRFDFRVEHDTQTREKRDGNVAVTRESTHTAISMRVSHYGHMRATNRRKGQAATVTPSSDLDAMARQW